MTWSVIVNPAAGRGRDLRDRTAAALEARDIDYRLLASPTSDAVRTIVEGEVAAGSTRFASVGGDGTANLVVDALMAHSWNAPPTLAILPAGSGSDFIRTFGLPSDLEGAADHLTDDSVYLCDVGVLEGDFGTRHFLNAANAGIAAASAARAARLPDRMGALRYTAGFWLTIASFRPGPVTVVVGRHRFESEAMNVVFANGQFFGGGMNVAPKAAAGDGLLDVQVFSGSRRAAFAIMPRVKRGSHLTHKGVRRLIGAEARLTCRADWAVEADGEAVGMGSIAVRLLPGAVRFKI